METVLRNQAAEKNSAREATRAHQLYERRKKLVPNGLGIFNPSSVQSAHDATIVDVDGNELIDFAGGIGVLNAGHCPAPVVKAIQEQAATFIHTSFNVAPYDKYLDLAEKMIELLPHGEQTKVMFINSGAEAVENAIKIARQATKRSAAIAYSAAFHGRTMMAMALSSKITYKAGCGPFAPEVYRIDYPVYRKNIQTISEEEFSEIEIEKLKDFFKTSVRPEDVAAIIIELVQGEGGFFVAPKAYVKKLRELCDEHGIILIFDEVQSGFGRTGKWAAFHHYDVIPDISTWAKSLGSGMPIAAVMGKARIMDSAAPSTIGGTYAGNAVCCAAALATLNYMQEIYINSLGEKVGKIVRARFEKFHQQFPHIISEVRGLGAMLAFEISHNADHTKPNAELTTKIIHECARRGLVIISAGVNGNVIRILSPLVIEERLLNKGLDILESVLLELG